VGIRLQDEDDFPYFYQEGFPEDFLLKENSLLARTKDGGICRDECGDICLECTCGLVVTSKTDPSSPLFTKGGSSWTNDSFPFLHVPADNDIRTNPRNECIHQGFASVALIPIRAKGRVVGLLQLNDRRKGCFTLEGIETLEKIAENVGESMLRKQAEEALRESNEQFTTLADSIPNLAWWANGDGYITWYNRRWYEYTGTTLEEMEGWGWQNVHDLSTLPRVLQQWQKSIATGQPFEMEFPLRGADGVYRTFLTRSIPMKDSNGNVVRWFGTNTDISAQKEVEEQLKQSEERQRLLAETMLQGVVHQDANGKIISMNPAAERILGRSQEDLLGGSSVAVEHDTIRENGEIFPGLEHPTMVALRTGLPVRSVVMGVFNPKLQEYRWIGIDAVPVFRPGEDRPSEVYSIFGDISERKQAQKALQEEHDVLEQRVTERTMDLSATINHLQSEILERELAEMKLREETAARMQATESLREKERMFILQSRQAAMGEMIGNIAHQWRQPLNVLGLNIQKLMLYYDLGEFTREFLENSVNKSMDVIQHMSSTIDDFRNFFKPDKKPAEFRVSGAITRTLALVGESFKNDAIGIDVITKDDAVINGYTNEYAQVVLNILNNARDVLLERGIKDPRVTINLCAEEGKSVVTIADNAGGIPEEIMEKIFDPYFTTKGPQTGTGLGLFMSKSIIEKNMNGRLTARNIVDGAQFRIEV
jgi:PAS domain S-box-containing protein